MEKNGIGLPIIYALLAALIGGILWTLIIVFANYEIGLVAWAIGGLAGYAVVLPSKENITPAHQIIAVIAGLVGILIGKYFSFNYIVFSGFQGIFDPSSISLFINNLEFLFGGMDIIFVLLAIVTAWQIPMKLARPEEADVMEEEEVK